MPDSKIDNMTLHEKFNELEHLTRNLILHLEKGFIPKAHSVSKLLRKKDQESDDVKDITIRNQVRDLLKSEEYTNQLYTKMSAFCESIEQSVAEIENNL